MANRWLTSWKKLLLIGLGYWLALASYPALGQYQTDQLDRFYQAPVGSWYATTEAGTHVVSGKRIFLFENVKLHEELAASISSLINGAIWKEGYLLSHELFLSLIWPSLPQPVRVLLRGGSQAWLLWTTWQAIASTASPLAQLLKQYYQYWRAPRYEGLFPILVNDPQLSFRFFLQAYFPEQESASTEVIIDRIPALSALPHLTHKQDHLNPWHLLMDEMIRSDIERLSLSGDANGDIHIRFRTGEDEQQPVQTIHASVNREYQPVPWLLEKIRQRTDRRDINIHASLLSQEILELVTTMLSCHRAEITGIGHGSACGSGQLSGHRDTWRYSTPYSIAPQQIWEQRLPNNGRLFSLTGCHHSPNPLCWENTLIMGEGDRLSPWPTLTLNSRFSTFKERNERLLMGYEPQRWFTGSFFQVRVPELVTRLLLGTANIAGQVAVNRLVTSLHHQWWQNGAPSSPREAFKRSTMLPERYEKLHAQGDDTPCPSCPDGACQFSACPVCKNYFETATMVFPGCNGDNNTTQAKHALCSTCFFNVLAHSNVEPCHQCNSFHRNLIDPANYFFNPDDAQAVPACSVCRAPFNHLQGNLDQYLGDSCNALQQKMRWLFSDNLGADHCNN